MAKKKTAKKSAGRAKTARKPAPKPARKASAKKRPAAKRAAPAGPVAVKTGGGATPAEVGRAVVEGFNAQRPDTELWDRWWSRNIVSVEGGAQPMAFSGRKGLAEKAAWWHSNFTVHGASAEGPYVGGTGFCIKFRVDAEEKATGKRSVMEEIGVYAVQNGKVVREEFHMGARQPVAAAPAEDLDGLPAHETAEVRV